MEKQNLNQIPTIKILFLLPFPQSLLIRYLVIYLVITFSLNGRLFIYSYPLCSMKICVLFACHFLSLFGDVILPCTYEQTACSVAMSFILTISVTFYHVNLFWFVT
uniref:Uncharacterized protein n=1 Tax=Cacopsylla melanoneura TaxID=428564 RepID=A0A8D8LHJ8_9HEMI